MISLDVENLFPSIPLNETLEYATGILFKLFGTKINKNVILKLLEFCTKDVTFKFGDIYYQQINGVQMGSPLSPLLTELYLVKFENEKLNFANLNFNIKFFYRYVDDIFAIVDKNIDGQQLLTKVNKLDKNLKFTI